MARQNVRQTSTDTTTGTPGVPGALVWVITVVQLVPAFAEGGLLGGVIRGFFGPVLAALLWHLAMGLEIRHARPAALSTGLLAVIAREARERLLSRLGLAVRGLTAAQLTRDRATATAVRLAARRWRGPLAKRRLAAAVARAAVATDPAQRERLLAELAARRGALALATLALPAPWQPPGTPVPAVPDTPSTPVLDVPEEPWTAVVPDGAELLPVVARPAQEPADEYTEYIWREVVPAGVRTLPLVPPTRAIPAAPAAQAAPAAADADPLLDQVAADYAGAITDGRPSVRELKAKYGIGQTRAQRLRDQLTTDTREKAHA
ncbi:hypothetical protein IF129_10340 [Streptomyces chumphonensis]|uniref:Uncharacterized protein n=2 Tax=Streptomyces chumphonensis TaxID=1214925 RepID=A0A927F0E0_9ACTN|nr:hypothetical protein [Streptomyces chumphonensis]